MADQKKGPPDIATATTGGMTADELRAYWTPERMARAKPKSMTIDKPAAPPEPKPGDDRPKRPRADAERGAPSRK